MAIPGDPMAFPTLASSYPRRSPTSFHPLKVWKSVFLEFHFSSTELPYLHFHPSLLPFVKCISISPTIAWNWHRFVEYFLESDFVVSLSIIFYSFNRFSRSLVVLFVDLKSPILDALAPGFPDYQAWISIVEIAWTLFLDSCNIHATTGLVSPKLRRWCAYKFFS